MKASVALLALSCSTLVAAHAASHDPRHVQHGMQFLRKRQATSPAGTTASSVAAAGAHSEAATSAAAAAAAASSSNANAAAGGAQTSVAAAPAASSTAANKNPLESLTDALTPSSASSSSSSSETAENAPESSSSSNSAANAATSAAATAVTSSTAAHSTAASVKDALTAAQSTVVSIVTPSDSASSASAASSSASAAAASASAAAADDKKSSSGGGISHGTLIAIIVVASCVAGIGAIWTIVRKTKFSPSKRFEDKLAPIDFVPEVPEYGRALHRDRSQSSMGGGGGYAESLARSDSKGSQRGGNLVMSDSSPHMASIPYQGPGYVQASYYGESTPSYSPQPGYPHEQPTFYPSLQRGPSVASSLNQHALSPPLPQGSYAPAGQLGRMNTTGGYSMAGGTGGAVAYDYAAQARAQGMRY